MTHVDPIDMILQFINGMSKKLDVSFFKVRLMNRDTTELGGTYRRKVSGMRKDYDPSKKKKITFFNFARDEWRWELSFLKLQFTTSSFTDLLIWCPHYELKDALYMGHSASNRPDWNPHFFFKYVIDGDKKWPTPIFKFFWKFLWYWLSKSLIWHWRSLSILLKFT